MMYNMYVIKRRESMKMTNTSIQNYLTEEYNRYSFTNKYIIGFVYKKLVYFGFFNADELDKYLSLSRASSKNGGGYCLKFAPRNDQKLAMLTNCSVLCSEEYFNEQVNSNKYNKGENFERLITEANGQEWVKDNIPFTKDGDITINGVAYQIKFQKATFCTEHQIMRLLLEE